MNFTPHQVARLIADVYNGTASEQDIPEDLYLAIADNLKTSLYSGFGGAVADFTGPPAELLNELRTNVYMFSAAKSYQQMREYTDLLYNLDGLRPFKDFKRDALEKYAQYNVDWLATERATAIAGGQQGAFWQRIESEKALFPYLRFTAVIDKGTTDECRHMDNLVAPVDHPVWKTCYPPNHWNCRSTVVQLDQPSLVDTNAAIERARKHSEEEMQDVFKMNVGKDKYIYSPEHPYFKVAPRDIQLAQNNFNLPIPPAETRPAPRRRPAPRVRPAPAVQPTPQIKTHRIGDADYSGADIQLLGGATYSPDSQAHIMRVAGVPHGFTGLVTLEKRSGGIVRIVAKAEDGLMTMQREIINGRTISNDFIEIKAGSRWKGKAAKILDQQIKYAADNGYENIICTASRENGANGYYTYQRLGFRFDIRAGANTQANHTKIGNLIGDFNTKMSRRGSAVRAGNLREMMATKEGQAFWKDNGFTHVAQFELQAGSYSRNTLHNYMVERGLVRAPRIPVVPRTAPVVAPTPTPTAPKKEKAVKPVGIPKAKSTDYRNANFSGDTMTMDERVHYAKASGIPNDWASEIYFRKNSNGTIDMQAQNRDMIMHRRITLPTDGKPGKMSNEYFRITDAGSKKYSGYKIFNEQTEYLTKHKYSEIQVHAARGGDFNGYYTWWRFGYRLHDTGQFDHQAFKMKRVVSSFNEKVAGRNGIQKVKDIYDLAATKQGQDFWKEHGFDFYGKFDLKPGSYSKSTLKKYVNERAAKK